MVKLILHFPPQALMPNKKTNRWKKSKTTSEAREEAYTMALAQLNGQRYSRVKLIITFIPKDKRSRDFDSLLRALKPIIDGALVDTKLVPDDSPAVIQEITLRIGRPNKKRACTEIEVIEQ